MSSDSAYNEMRGAIPTIKEFFQTRHYVQCITLCEKLLTRSTDEIHSIHLAFLNFYLALSHDTIGREATLKNRTPELELAEKHYVAALVALKPSEPPKLEDIPELSPSHTTPGGEPHEKRRRGSDAPSFDSEYSAEFSMPSVDDHDSSSDCEPTPKRSNYFKYSPPSRNFLDDVSMSPKLSKMRPNPITTLCAKSTPSPHAEQYSSDICAFRNMVEIHLASVRDAKEQNAFRNVRFTVASSRSSTSSAVSRPVSRDATSDKDAELDTLRRNRMVVLNSRPRFDPSSVQKLCEDALSDLRITT